MAAGRIVFLGLGSNLGDRIGGIRAALRGLGELGRVIDTSSLVESPAWTPPGWTAGPQPHYVNGAVALETKATPLELLRGVKALERRLGRAPGVRYGARTIDIDLLAFADGTEFEYDGDGDASLCLSVPHPRMHERAFVLQPLAEIAPALVHPTFGYTVAQLHRALPNQPPLPRVAGIGRVAACVGRAEPIVWRWGARSYLMGVLNVTPDSFSDGGKLASLDVARRTAAQMLADGADVLDVGGASSRPGASAVSEAEELERVLPLVLALRADGLEGLISVDTTSAAVARAAIAAGADLVNDVSAGSADEAMLPTLAQLGVPCVLMHSRGSARTMTSLAEYGAEGGGVVDVVCSELGARVEAARAAGVARFDMVLDPGIGFAKRAEHNLQLLRALGSMRSVLGLPLLLGASRKRFLGELTGEAVPERRDWGTAAVTAGSVPNADIHRVHDVRAMKHVLAVADAIWREKDYAR